MKDGLEELAETVAGTMEESIKQMCPTCKRGAATIAAPTMEDLDALVDIRDGFNKLRREFSPMMAERFQRFDRTISYLHTMIAGSE